ncbi:hypothetical protein AU074_13940 [Pseudomonas sp. ATCC PTA-122608]|uniref:zincin-like metallopeptidase domain-containing protein n=1 Tax=Pseudomonas sp. ATCC PTA-122608 TaxID=1771311 RepID=UPI00096B9EB8|nr:zincin-like metallopeptidase domain-containing protein [Pseudomonas sp. ATCC PTA-122608]OLY72272.1 hypothetical protein AU074_13940 [Pseudomonas sp. ATCC PTA-122608]
MTKALEPKEKTDFIEAGNIRTDDFLKSQVEKIADAMASDEDLIWNSPTFKIKYMNPITKTVYNLENTILLTQLANDKGYELPFYLTAKQGFTAGLSNKGEKSDFIVNRFGAPIGFFKDEKSKEPDLLGVGDSKGKVIYRRASKLTPVFNLGQFTGERPEAVHKLMSQYQQKATPEELETVYQALLETIPTPLKRLAGTNHYRPGEDTIYMNPSSHFKSRLHETNTLLHETSHSYGHETRKNRPSLRHYSEGIEHRAYEELVANLSAQAVVKYFDLHIDPSTQKDLDAGFMKNHTTYDAGWAKRAYSKDTTQVFKAANDADRTASSIIHLIEQNLILKLKANPDLKISELVKERLIAKAEPEKQEASNEAVKKTYKKSTYKR